MADGVTLENARQIVAAAARKAQEIDVPMNMVMRYHRELMQAILHDRVQVAKAVNAKVITLD